MECILYLVATTASSRRASRLHSLVLSNSSNANMRVVALV